MDGQYARAAPRPPRDGHRIPRPERTEYSSSRPARPRSPSRTRGYASDVGTPGTLAPMPPAGGTPQPYTLGRARPSVEAEPVRRPPRPTRGASGPAATTISRSEVGGYSSRSEVGGFSSRSEVGGGGYTSSRSEVGGGYGASRSEVGSSGAPAYSSSRSDVGGGGYSSRSEVGGGGYSSRSEVGSSSTSRPAIATERVPRPEHVPIARPDKPKTIDIPGKTIDYRVSRVVILCKDCGRDVGFYPARHKCGQPNVDEDELAPPVPPVPVPPARPSGEASSDVSATHSDTSAPRSAGANWGGSLWSKLKESVATGAAKRTSGDEASHAATPPAAEGDKRDSGDHAAGGHENGNGGAAATGMWGVWSKLKQQMAVATTKNNEDEDSDPEEVSKALRDYYAKKGGPVPDFLKEQAKEKVREDDLAKFDRLAVSGGPDRRPSNTSTDPSLVGGRPSMDSRTGPTYPRRTDSPMRVDDRDRAPPTPRRSEDTRGYGSASARYDDDGGYYRGRSRDAAPPAPPAADPYYGGRAAERPARPAVSRARSAGPALRDREYGSPRPSEDRYYGGAPPAPASSRGEDRYYGSGAATVGRRR
ncbi:hypothetical protein AMAG_09311 [Allomyces macrogynus ATCC 38327]|uniref:Mso1 N-terminal domain-containing protein n=1 Tax=Allomyces macrogynus (strain ATCC 38327) TaxID=578462 RepID=A0A0L0SPI0_ALLM3|nr:hypothetical protein AMAG_09311 [Allomyces macrogynus ATCC 38327]|eukprot:KNE64280.1 hypothetical protein AMAG_09311 [Allomyces macrogynus ATCC 38327]